MCLLILNGCCKHSRDGPPFSAFISCEFGVHVKALVCIHIEVKAFMQEKFYVALMGIISLVMKKRSTKKHIIHESIFFVSYMSRTLFIEVNIHMHC